MLPRVPSSVAAQFLNELAGHWVVGVQLKHALHGRQRFLEAARVRQRAHQVEVCVPGVWIVREDMAEVGPLAIDRPSL